MRVRLARHTDDLDAIVQIVGRDGEDARVLAGGTLLEQALTGS